MFGTKPDFIIIDAALTEEGWRQWLEHTRDLQPLTQRGAHSMAAIALHEHPLGFTWTDHDLLINLACDAERDAIREGAYEDCALAAASLRARGADLRNLAARIGALLAPR